MNIKSMVLRLCKSVINITFILLMSCSGGKYKMYDMALDEEIDIGEFIESGEYTPEYCEGRIDRVIKNNPPELKPQLSDKLNLLLSKWATEEEYYRNKKGDSVSLSHSLLDIIKNTKYAYSYFLAEKPMHVFSTCITITHGNIKESEAIFIRVDDIGNIVGDYITDGVVQNKCDDEINCPTL